MPENDYEDLANQLSQFRDHTSPVAMYVLLDEAAAAIRALLAERADIWDAGCIQGQFDGLAHFSPNPYRDRSDT